MEEMPPLINLRPQDKLNMSLDEIIRAEKIVGGISHKMSCSKPYRWQRKRYSQQWRLGRNGPYTPRRRSRTFHPNPNAGNIHAFLSRKLRTAPATSVFHRLGWNPSRYAASKYLYQARYYRRRPAFRTFGGRPLFDPLRAQKLVQAQRYYRLQTGLTTAHYVPVKIPSASKEALKLNEYNLARLSDALGGTITSVREDVSEHGDVTTIITRKTNTDVRGFHEDLGDGQLDVDVKWAITQLQKLPYDGDTKASFAPSRFIITKTGVDFRCSPHYTEVPLNQRFTVFQGSENRMITD